jgi:hypothetical protein
MLLDLSKYRYSLMLLFLSVLAICVSDVLENWQVAYATLPCGMLQVAHATLPCGMLQVAHATLPSGMYRKWGHMPHCPVACCKWHMPTLALWHVASGTCHTAQWHVASGTCHTALWHVASGICHTALWHVAVAHATLPCGMLQVAHATLPCGMLQVAYATLPCGMLQVAHATLPWWHVASGTCHTAPGSGMRCHWELLLHMICTFGCCEAGGSASLMGRQRERKDVLSSPFHSHRSKHTDWSTLPVTTVTQAMISSEKAQRSTRSATEEMMRVGTRFLKQELLWAI